MKHPAVDVFTEHTAVVLQERPVVCLASWIADTVHTCARTDRELHIVTPPTSRVTFPLETILATPGARWVVRNSDGSKCYDGLRGTTLRWDGSRFTPAGGPAEPFTAPAPTPHGTIRLDLSLVHQASPSIELGKAANDCVTALAGSPPTGWGLAEPATQRWDPHELTRFCRQRAPKPTTLITVGGKPDTPTVGVLRVKRTPAGVHEHLRLAVGSRDKPDTEAIDRLAEHLADQHTVRTFTADLRPGRSDCTAEPHHAGFPIPYGILIGPEGLAEHGLEHAQQAPAPHVLLTGPPGRPSCWIRLPSATNDDHANPAEVLTDVLAHFGVLRHMADPPSNHHR